MTDETPLVAGSNKILEKTSVDGGLQVRACRTIIGQDWYGCTTRQGDLRRRPRDGGSK